MPEKRFFGTDGIRGPVGGELINPRFILNLAWATGQILLEQGCTQIVIGKDTRISGYILESVLEAGFLSAGADVLLSGPMPTPAVSYLARTQSACWGVVISASHNPHQDNGIKFFDHHGQKLSDELELSIEQMMQRPLKMVASEKLGKAQRINRADTQYVEFCQSTAMPGLSLAGLKIVIDCAHGAAYHIAPEIFSKLGADVRTIGTQPDGLNINLNCGVTHLPTLQKAVANTQADIGIALDGDADRVMMMDNTGRVFGGDQIIYMIVQDRLKQGINIGPVVGTSMSNLGLEKAIAQLGLQFIRADVGDRHVTAQLKQHDGLIGGESSGHVVCLDKTTTGDGIVTALQVLSAMYRQNKTLHELIDSMQLYAQVMVNVQTDSMLTPKHLILVQPLIDEAIKTLVGKGRILIRPSGTQPLIRIMVEGDDTKMIKQIANQLADQVTALL